MTTRKMFTILLVANLLTVALVTAAFQVGSLVEASPAPRTGGNQMASHDITLYPSVPTTMNYQGVLKDSSGTPLTGLHNLTFTIYVYSAVPGGVWSSVWTETQTNVNVANGLFNVELGSVQPLRGDVFAGILAIDGDLELGVKVDGGAELSPRTKLLSVPYAHRADYVNRFPKPHYDSGWTAIAPGASKTFNHNLSGNVDDYVVDVQFKSSSAVYAVHQQYYGMNYDDIQQYQGAYWCKLTTSGINVVRGGADLYVEQVRVRIWRIE